jgi:MYXO-CTERM domain-containing protein
LGYRATRWDAGTTSATQLGILSTNLSGVGNADAYEINDSGLAVGLEDQYSGNTDEGQHAMLWTANGTAIDLNSLIDPNSGWTLAFASSINDNDIVEGMGTFDPDGSGPDPGYERAFILDVSSVAQTPEPTSLLALAGLTLLARRRR